MMNVKVRGLEFSYDGDGEVVDVNVRFDANESDGAYLNGAIKMTSAEYFETPDLQGIQGLIKTKVKEKFSQIV
jgi:hypothetical protein